MMEGIQRKSYSVAVIDGVRKRARVLVGESIVRKTDKVLNKGDDIVVCLPGAKIEAITERVENIVGSGKGGTVLVHVGTNNVEREGTTAIVGRDSIPVRRPDSQSREPGLKSHCGRFEPLASLITIRCHSSLSCINEYLAIQTVVDI